MYNIKHLPGQINLQSNLGQIIYNLVLKENFTNIVDVGTWNGMGTTTCIMRAIEDKQCKTVNVYSVELYEEMINVAKENLKHYTDNFNLKILHGRIADLSEVYQWFDHSSIDFSNDPHARLWYHKDMELLKKSENITQLLPQNIDLLILDGGEYSTYPEWLRLKDRSKYIVLDDTNILKCNKIRKEIIESSDYTILHDVSNDRNGFLVGVKNA